MKLSPHGQTRLQDLVDILTTQLEENLEDIQDELGTESDDDIEDNIDEYLANIQEAMDFFKEDTDELFSTDINPTDEI